MDESSGLSPCEECGGTPIYKHASAENISKPRQMLFWYECGRCGIKSHHATTKKSAAYEWNYEQNRKRSFDDGGDKEMAGTKGGTAKGWETRRKKAAEKAAAKAATTSPEAPEMTPKEAVDLLHDTPDNSVMADFNEDEFTLNLDDVAEPDAATSGEDVKQDDVAGSVTEPDDDTTEETEASTPEAEPFPEDTSPEFPVPKRKDRRSSREAAAAAADPANVAEIQELIGKFYTVEEVAAAIGTTTRTILQRLRDGKLKGVKIGGNWKIPANALRRFMEGEAD